MIKDSDDLEEHRMAKRRTPSSLYETCEHDSKGIATKCHGTNSIKNLTADEEIKNTRMQPIVSGYWYPNCRYLRRNERCGDESRATAPQYKDIFPPRCQLSVNYSAKHPPVPFAEIKAQVEKESGNRSIKFF